MTPHGRIHGARWHADYHFDDGATSGRPGWYVEYLSEHGDCVDDSEKVWHPDLPTDPEAEAEVKTIAAAYLAKLEAGAT